jgi:hypothetical protein
MMKRFILIGVLLAGIGVLVYRTAYRRGYEESTANRPQTAEESGVAPETADDHRAIPSVTRIRREAKRANDRGIEFKRIVRYRKDGVYSVDEMGTTDLALGYAVLALGPMSDLRSLFRCEGKSTSGGAYFSSSPNCGGPDAVGEKTKMAVYARLIDATFMPLFLCRQATGSRYLSLNRLCEAEADKVEEMVGYVRSDQIVVQ